MKIIFIGQKLLIIQQILFASRKLIWFRDLKETFQKLKNPFYGLPILYFNLYSAGFINIK